MNKLEQQMVDMENRIKQLEANQISIYMPYNIRDVIRNSIIDTKIDDATSVAALKRTQTVTIGAGGGSVAFDVPNDFNGELTMTWKDKVYKIPYYV